MAQKDAKTYRLFDAKDQILGRLATEIARSLAGKDRVDYQPNVVNGDFVIVINADRVRLSGEKAGKKIYYRHTEYPGGIKQRTFKEQMEIDSRKIITDAVKGMLPKNRLTAKMMGNLRVYKDDNHPYKDKV